MVNWNPFNTCAFDPSLASGGLTNHGAFYPEPQGRGTVGLVWSCVITFGICVWTTVHPNILPLGSTSKTRRVYKLILMFLAAFVPEIIMMCSYSEWRKAGKIHRSWCKKFNIKPGSKEDRMGMQGAFFVLMGGFTVWEFEMDADESLGGVGGGSGGRTYYSSTLTARGFKRYVESGQITQDAFDKRNIIDKGKASNLAKMLVFVQTTWFVVQCVARKLSCLPLTLIELHVAIQVACAVISSIFWWYKPLDVDQPIKITVDRYPQLEWPSPEAESSKFSKHTVVTERTRCGFLRTLCRALYDLLCNGSGPGKNMVMMGLLILFNGACHLFAWNNYFPTTLEWYLWIVSALAVCGGALLYAIVLGTSCYENRFICAIWELRFYGKRRSLEGHLWTRLTWEREQICGGKMQDSHEALGYESGADTLPSHVFSSSSASVRDDYSMLEKRANSRWKYVMERILFDLSWLLAAGYFLCIGYLTVESFLSLRDLPDGSYLTPAWIDYWPH